jgi:anti-sigma regulatory factor (Ser/Thr protein kinase)
VILLNVIKGVDHVADLEQLRAEFGHLNGKRRGRLDVSVFDGQDDDQLTAALACPARVYLDADCTAFTLSPAAFELRVTTATAKRLDLAMCFTRFLATRFPHMAKVTDQIRHALQEAVANAVIHGNLGLNSALRGSLASLRVFAATMEQRLSQPAYARRPLTIGARAQREGVSVSVEDCGAGFDPGSVKPSSNPAAGGMGLSIMRGCSRTMVHSRDGRRVTMTFSQDGQAPGAALYHDIVAGR